MWNVRGRPALVLVVLVALLPLSAAAQAPTDPDSSSPVLGRGWSASPLERLLERSVELELSPEQIERLNTEVERRNTASAEVREAMTQLRALRQEQMTIFREVLTEDQIQSLRREMRSARETRPDRWRSKHPGPRGPGWTPRHLPRR